MPSFQRGAIRDYASSGTSFSENDMPRRCVFFDTTTSEPTYLPRAAMPPRDPLPDVVDWTFTGNRLHPTHKPNHVLTPLIRGVFPPGATVLDPLCGSGSTLAAAKLAGRDYIEIELDEIHHRTAIERLAR
jgi:site-specific DNA-methyltransferase (adenine-specific)